MRKLKYISTTIFSLLLCFTLLVPSIFAANSQRVYDNAGLLNNTEITNLQQSISELEATYDHDIFILTTNNTNGKTSRDFADDFLFDLGYGKDTTSAILLLIDMDNRQVYISTSGDAISYFTDARIDLTIDAFYEDLVEGDYFTVCKVFLKKVEAVFSQPIPKGNEVYNLPRDILTITDYLSRAGIAAAIALIISIITYFSICRSYTHPRFVKPVAHPDRSTINFTDKKDQFIHTHTTRVRIHNDSNSSGGGGMGGGSSTHTSSGGGTFGGGGRGF